MYNVFNNIEKFILNLDITIRKRYFNKWEKKINILKINIKYLL